MCPRYKWAYGLREIRFHVRPNREKCGWGKATHFYSYDLVNLASFQGSLEALQWLSSQGVPLDNGEWECGERAALGGHIEVLEWLRSKGYRFKEKTMECAAEGGCLDATRRLRDQGCLWSEITCAAAASGGHLETLKWYFLSLLFLSVSLC